MSSIYRAIVGMKNYSILFFPAIILFICSSNFLHVFGSLNLANFLINVDAVFDNIKTGPSLLNLFNIPLPKFITNEQALYIGFTLGFIGYKKSFVPIENFVSIITKIINFVLKRIFIPMLPLFIFGMTLKMINDGIFEMLIKNASLFATMFIVLITYLAILLLISSGFSMIKGYKITINILPAVLTALSSMSSTIALPFSLKASHKNTISKGFSDFFMPQL